MSQTYTLIDSGNFQKLEQVGPFRLVRPSPQAVWLPSLSNDVWEKVDARFARFSGGDGKWTVFNKKLKDSWVIQYGGMSLRMELTDFGHLGLFAEQNFNWDRIRQICREGTLGAEEFNVLNLFAYTGGASLAAAQGGARVAHVDASKTSVNWARQNAELNELQNHDIRWLIDDVQKFTSREIRRNRKYQGIILDPPSFGRGTKAEVWKIEEHLIPLLGSLKDLLAPNFKFILLSSHSNGYTPVAMRNLLLPLIKGHHGRFIEEEMLVRESESGRALPSGAHCWFIRD
ncbi:MAG: class I SAM-dependent methyltransferase [Proteobacteria bacterium]|nr:class I SAM-dependent methyltransferase [Pseudomonadota bacterium]